VYHFYVTTSIQSLLLLVTVVFGFHDIQFPGGIIVIISDNFNSVEWCRRLLMENENIGTVFATDAILATLMCSPRSMYSWDIVIQKVGNKLFFDKRDASFDLLTVSYYFNTLELILWMLLL
jgi:hypothetical protein